MFDLEAFELKPKSYLAAPFAWVGGKSLSLKRIIPQIPSGKIFVDGCCGSGIITLNSPDGFQTKVCNDLHNGVIGFYKCLQSSKDQLIERLNLVLHSREEFIWSRDSWVKCQDPIEQAARWYYTIRVSFNSIGMNFGRTLKGRNELANNYWNSLIQLNEICARIKEIQFESLDVIQCIQKYDSSETVFYIDPDYDEYGSHYKHHVDHPKLLAAIQEAKGHFMVSSYPNKLYDSQTFWTDRQSWAIATNIQGVDKIKTRAYRATEVLWIKAHS